LEFLDIEDIKFFTWCKANGNSKEELHLQRIEKDVFLSLLKKLKELEAC